MVSLGTSITGAILSRVLPQSEISRLQSCISAEEWGIQPNVWGGGLEAATTSLPPELGVDVQIEVERDIPSLGER